MAGLDQVRDVVIHPAIGIARVGNSPEAFFWAPETPGPQPDDKGDYRDGKGRIKRQAQRFRLFGRNAKGEVVCEITARDADITWTVHIANRKAAWYRFDQALDIPASAGTLSSDTPGIASLPRNPQVTGKARDKLTIDPGARSITGCNTNAKGASARYAFDSGTFWGKKVYLGELRTDGDGNLVFLGGHGVSASYDDRPPSTFANNTAWHDDISDGSVDATVSIDGRALPVVGAWVVTAPPNYAPDIKSIVTGHDLLRQVMIDLDPRLNPKRPVFSRDIWPLLRHFPSNQWVNAGFLNDFGFGRASDFTTPENMARLNDPGTAARPLREAVLEAFRDPTSTVLNTNGWPAYYGDAVTLDPTTTDPLEFMPVLESQYRWLKQWAAGDLVSNGPPKWRPWDQLSPAERAAGMDFAALDETLGGPFHPGCEFTWPMRQPIMWQHPTKPGADGVVPGLFRLKRRPEAPQSFGAELTSSIALAKGGPLDGSAPGDISRWMAVPWQTDTGSCLSGYKLYFGQYLPTFWPARVPNDILTAEAYATIMNPKASEDEKVAAFAVMNRLKWLRCVVYIPGTDPAQQYPTEVRLENFLHDWAEVGIIVRKPGPQSPLFPELMWVETGRSVGEKPKMAASIGLMAALDSPLGHR
jgi:hypothetical protein